MTASLRVEALYIVIFVSPMLLFVTIVGPFSRIVDSLTVVLVFFLCFCKGLPRLCIKGVETTQQESKKERVRRKTG